MPDPLGFADQLLGFAPPLARVIIWGVATSCVSMGIYALLLPKEKLRTLKAAQKEARSKLWKHDGSFAEMQRLIKNDLALSLRLIAVLLIPFTVAVAPIVLLATRLGNYYPGSLVSFGPEWMQGFEFWYMLPLLIVSLLMKQLLKLP